MVKIVDMTSALKQVRESISTTGATRKPTSKDDKLYLSNPNEWRRRYELEKTYKDILRTMPASEKNTEAGKIKAMDLARVKSAKSSKNLKLNMKNKGTLKLEDMTSALQQVRESDAYDNDRFIVKGGAVKKDNSNTPDTKDHVYAPNAKIAKQLHSQGKKVYKEELSMKATFLNGDDKTFKGKLLVILTNKLKNMKRNITLVFNMMDLWSKKT